MFPRLHHLFFLKEDKRIPSSTCAIYLRLTIAGKRTELSTGKRVEKNRWLTGKGRMCGNSNAANQLNEELALMEFSLLEAYHTMLRQNEQITPGSLKNKYLGIEDRSRMLVSIFEQHNDRIVALIPKDYSAGTLERYKTSLSHTIEFMKWKYDIPDIDIAHINHEFINEYDFYLRHIRNCSNNTVVRYMGNFKKIIRYCLAMGWLVNDPFAMYRGKVKIIERAFLTENELRAIMEKTFTINRLNLVKDVFLFSCFTGLSYADVKKIQYQHIVIGFDSHKWLSIKRTKTGTSTRVPLLPAAQKILEKYRDQSSIEITNRLLPVLSNQKMNSYLKEIAACCEIAKELTFHVARHTFATTVTLNNHVPIESVSKLLGHKNLSTTQHYAKLMDDKISTDMQLLYLKF